MNKLPVALGLIAGLAFATPTFNITSADAATSATNSTAKTTHHHHAAHCKASATHKCPVSHHHHTAKKK
jgi:hypothetical protein